MQDLTGNEKEKKEFIIHILMDKKNKQYKILYADGHVQPGKPISKENYQFYLDKMEEQYFLYEQNFVAEKHRRIRKAIKKQFFTFSLGLLGIYLDYTLDIHILMKMLLFFLIICGNFLFFTLFQDAIQENKMEIKKKEVMQYFLTHQEEFGILCKDETGKTTFFPLLSLNTIEQYTSISELKDLFDQKKKKEEIYLTIR